MHAAFSKCDGNVCIGNASVLQDIDGGELRRVSCTQERACGNLYAREKEKAKRVGSDGI